MTLSAASIYLFLLPIAALTGWIFGRRSAFTAASRPVSVNPDYLRGLRYLVSEDADKAIEVFTRLMEVDNETIETHLALGDLFRRQGEVDRALKIHQNLVARPNLSPKHRNQACYELARDYLRAGVLDRAENLYKGLADQGIYLERSLSGLVSIYEQERDWERAIETSRRLEAVQGHNLRPVIAQYYCEMADECIRRKEHEDALGHLRRALTEHPECVRASLMEGDVEEKNENYSSAIKAYQRVLKQDIEFASEVIGPLERCYQLQQNEAAWVEQLQQLMQRYIGSAPRVALARQLVREGREREAVEELVGFLEVSPSWVGFHHLLELQQASHDESLSGIADALQKALQQMIAASAQYHCSSCGFEGHRLHWQCPRCKHWNSLSPVKDVIPVSTDSNFIQPAA